MRHQIRWTSKKIHQRLALAQKFINRQRQSLLTFRYKKLNTPPSPSPINVDDGDWEMILPNEYWGLARINFTLHTQFNIQNEWLATVPLALYLPLGISGDFSHPEAFVYINREPYASVNRHHQELVLPEKNCNGKTHTLALHGWTGIDGSTVGGVTKKLQMKTCEVVQIDQPICDFIARARVTFGITHKFIHLMNEFPDFHFIQNKLTLTRLFVKTISTFFPKFKNELKRKNWNLSVGCGLKQTSIYLDRIAGAIIPTQKKLVSST